MSIESAKLFVDRMKTDEDFAKKISGCKDQESLGALVKQAGFDFTSEELESTARKLSDEEMDQVAGGGGASHLIPEILK